MFWEVDSVFTIHGAETRDGNHDSKEDATEGAKEGATEVQSNRIAPGNGILGRGLRPYSVGETDDVLCRGRQSKQY